MSFYRTLLAAVAALALTAPVFADETTTTTTTTGTETTQTTEGAGQLTSTDQQTTETKININKATTKELMKVKGLNASKARAIVSYRKKHGDFKSLEDLGSVKGFKKVKPDTLKEIQDQLTVE